MIPASIDFRCRSNAAYSEELAFTDGDTPLNLFGKTADMQVRLYPNGPLVFTPTLEIDVAAGTINVNMSQTVLRQAFVDHSIDNKAISLSHDIRITEAGVPDVWAQGVVQIEAGVTLDG